MENLRKHTVVNKVLSLISSSVIPAIINYVAIAWWYDNGINTKLELNRLLAFIGIISAANMLILLLLGNWLLPKFKIFRAYRKYEGKWLQIIPELEQRPYSIVDFKYNQELKKYELIGTNFCRVPSDGCVNFEAYRFVERTFKDGFYYITNQTTENKNGLGKIGFIKSNYDSLTRAEGYFFDSGTENISKKYNTKLIKCNRAFFEHIGSQHRYLKIKKLPPIEIINLCKDFAQQELESYVNGHQPLSEKCNSKCDLCGCEKKN